MACSALKRSYRDQLRAACPGIVFIHLAGDQHIVTHRVTARPDHFMPPSLVTSQYQALEPLQGRTRQESPLTSTSRVDDLVQRCQTMAGNRCGDMIETHVRLTSSLSEAVAHTSPRPPHAPHCSRRSTSCQSTWSPWPPQRRPRRGGSSSRPALIGFAIIVLLITRFKLHPFLSLTIGALAVGAIAGMGMEANARVVFHRSRVDGGLGGRPHRSGSDHRQTSGRFWRRGHHRRHTGRQHQPPGPSRGPWLWSAQSSVCRCSSGSAWCSWCRWSCSPRRSPSCRS